MAANSTDVITLANNISLDSSLTINKTVNINLNNYNISADEKVFYIEGGSLNLTGTGTIYEKNPNYGAVMLVGSENSDDVNYSTINVEDGITLEGWSGIFINHKDKKSYGVTVTMNGKINAKNDTNGDPGIGIYVNGNVKNTSNCPVINLGETAHIDSTGNGIYAAGCSIYNINGAYIKGMESGLGIKSGTFNIKNGTIIGGGEDKTPTTGNNNGINASGTSIQIESNKNYVGNIEIIIDNGNFISENSNVIYEYTTNNSNTSVKSFKINNGNFTSKTNKDVFYLSDSFVNLHDKFIKGGIFSSDPSNFLESGYSASLNNNLYEVVENTASVFSYSNSNNNFIKIILTIIFLVIVFAFYYLKKYKKFSLFK